MHRESRDSPERYADADSVRHEQQEAVEGIAGCRDVSQDAGERRSRAWRRDEPAYQAHQERSRVAASAHGGKALMKGRGEGQIEGAKHGGRHGEEEENKRNDHEWVGEKCSESLAQQREGGAEGAEHDGDTGHVRGGEQEGATSRGSAAPAEDADSNRNHRVDARGERG